MDPNGVLLRRIHMDSQVYKRAELLARGHSDVHIREALKDGRLIWLRNGWYARHTADPDVVAAVRRGGALGCVSALGKHGFWVAPGYSGLHVRASKYARAMSSGFCTGYGGALPVKRAVDDPALALMYAARCMSREHWIAAADSVMNTARISSGELRYRMGHVPHVVDDWLPACDGRSQSGTESIVRVRLRKHGFRVVVQPHVFAINGWADLRVGRLLIECDSKQHHTSAENYAKDRLRDRKALVGRWLTMRLTYDDVLYNWDGVLADICAVTGQDRHRSRNFCPE